MSYEADLPLGTLLRALAALLEDKPVKIDKRGREDLERCVVALREHGYLPLFDLQNLESAFEIDPEHAIPCAERGLAAIEYGDPPEGFCGRDRKIDDRRVDRFARRLERAAAKMRAAIKKHT